MNQKHFWEFYSKEKFGEYWSLYERAAYAFVENNMSLQLNSMYNSFICTYIDDYKEFKSNYFNAPIKKGYLSVENKKKFGEYIKDLIATNQIKMQINEPKIEIHNDIKIISFHNTDKVRMYDDKSDLDLAIKDLLNTWDKYDYSHELEKNKILAEDDRLKSNLMISFEREGVLFARPSGTFGY